jgi:hypothetical protein
MLFYALDFWDRPTFSQAYYKPLFLSGLLCAGIFLPYFLWKWHYFGRIFPNPVYCKAVNDTYIYKLDWAYLRLIWPFLLLAVVACYKSKDKRPYFFWLPTVIYLVLLWKADVLSAFLNRLFLPVYALTLPLALQGLMRILDQYLPERKTVYSFALYIIAGNIAFFFIPTMSLKAYRNFTINPQQGVVLREQLADWLDHHVPQGSWVAVGDVGIIGYRNNLNFLDSYCLNNKAMSMHADRYQWQCEKVMQLKPEVIILQSALTEKETDYAPTDACLREKLKNNPRYRHETNLEFCDPYIVDCYRYEIFLLRQHERKT